MILQQIGLKHNTDKATFHKYLDFYQKRLPQRTFQGRLLEIGVMDGASLRMWHEYYPKAEIVGIDINDNSHLDIEGVTILQLNATDTEALQELGNFDIIVDDGSHMTAEQQKSFEQLFYKQLNKGGFYILEDLHTSLIPSYVNSKLTTIEYLKQLEHKIYHFQRDKKVNDSMTCVIEGKK